MSTEILITGYITSIIAYVVWNFFIIIEQAKLGKLPKAKDIIFVYIGIPFAPILLLAYPMLFFIESKLIEDKTNKAFLPTQDDSQKLHKKILDKLKKNNKQERK